MPNVLSKQAVEIGKRLRKKRNELNIKQWEAAEALEITDGYYSAIERGIRGFSSSLLLRIMQVYKLSADYILLGRLDNETTNDIVEEINSLPDDKRREFYSVIRTLLKIAK